MVSDHKGMQHLYNHEGKLVSIPADSRLIRWDCFHCRCTGSFPERESARQDQIIERIVAAHRMQSPQCSMVKVYPQANGYYFYSSEVW